MIETVANPINLKNDTEIESVETVEKPDTDSIKSDTTNMSFQNNDFTLYDYSLYALFQGNV